MDNPRVTILLPNYNNGDFLIECLESVRSQTFSDFKLIMIDDGSTDNSLEVFNSFEDSRFHLVVKDVNSGIVDSLNVGLEMLDTEYMVRLDGDDYMSLDRLEKLVNFMDENSEFGLCGSALQKFGEFEQTITFESDWLRNKANLIFNHSVGHATLIFRSELFTERGHRYSNDFKYMEDYHLLLDMMDETKFTSLSDVLYFYRQTSSHDPQKQIEERKDIYENFYKMLLSKLDVSNINSRSMLHVQLGRQLPISYKLKDFANHIEDLIQKNNERNMFPKELFQTLLEKKLDILKYKMVDQGKLSLWNTIGNWKLLKYYLRSKF